MFRYNVIRDPPGVENAEVVNAEMSVSRIALVTGAGRGIGRAIALRLAGEPGISAVAIHFRSIARDAEATAAEILKLGKEAETFKADFAQAPAAAAMIADVEARLGTGAGRLSF